MGWNMYFIVKDMKRQYKLILSGFFFLMLLGVFLITANGREKIINLKDEYADHDNTTTLWSKRRLSMIGDAKFSKDSLPPDMNSDLYGF